MCVLHTADILLLEVVLSYFWLVSTHPRNRLVHGDHYSPCWGPNYAVEKHGAGHRPMRSLKIGYPIGYPIPSTSYINLCMTYLCIYVYMIYHQFSIQMCKFCSYMATLRIFRACRSDPFMPCHSGLSVMPWLHQGVLEVMLIPRKIPEIIHLIGG